jgi:hypothetical protein
MNAVRWLSQGLMLLGGIGLYRWVNTLPSGKPELLGFGFAALISGLGLYIWSRQLAKKKS